MDCPALDTTWQKVAWSEKKVTSRRTVKMEIGEVKLTWDKAQHAVQNRAKWKQITVASCPTKDEEDY